MPPDNLTNRNGTRRYPYSGRDLEPVEDVYVNACRLSIYPGKLTYSREP